VYLYSYTLLLFLPVLHFLLVRLVPPPHSTASKSGHSLFARLVKVLPGVVWPDFWSRGEVKGGGGRSASGHNVGGGEGAGDVLCHAHSSRQLLKPDDIAASLMHHTAVLLTFGMTSPVLAAAVAATICLQALQWTMLVNRFVFKRLLMGGMWGGSEWEGSGVSLKAGGAPPGVVSSPPPAAVAPPPSQAPLQRDELVDRIIACIERERCEQAGQLPVSGAVIVAAGAACEPGSVSGGGGRSSLRCEQLDRSLGLVERSVGGFGALLSLCVLPVVGISCVFFVFFSWDIAADRLGFVQSVWVPVTAMCIPVVVTLHIKHFVLPRHNESARMCEQDNDNPITKL
jgi:hypothetical protein